MEYIFVGNRSNVLDRMIKLGCKIVDIFAVKESYLERYLKENNISYTAIDGKSMLIDALSKSSFDCLVSNGCPYILPVSRIKKENQMYINVHPSFLPDLKGIHPINGALFHGRSHGVTCHHMDDGIDTGKIITNIEIPICDNTDLLLLYQLSFLAEGEVFEKAYSQHFKSKYTANPVENSIYYSRKEEDLIISSCTSFEVMFRKIRAFGIPQLCARFTRYNGEYKILSAKLLGGDLINVFPNTINDQIIKIYDSNVLVKVNRNFVVFNLMNTEGLNENECFFGFSIVEE